MRPMSLFPLAPPLRATTLAPLSRSHVDFFSFFLSLSSHLFLSLNKKIPPDRDRPRLRRALHPPLVPHGRAHLPDDRGQAAVAGDGAGPGGPGQRRGGRGGVDDGGRRRRRRGVVESRDRRHAELQHEWLTSAAAEVRVDLLQQGRVRSGFAINSGSSDGNGDGWREE